MISPRKSAVSPIFAGILTVLSVYPAAHAAGDCPGQRCPSITAKRFMNGGTFCFAVGNSGTPGALVQNIKMTVRKSQGQEPYNIAAINALLRGTLEAPYVRYVDQLAGTATLAPSNDATLGDGAVLQIGLTGSSYGAIFNAGGKNPEIWSHALNLQLDPKTMAGEVYGVDAESSPLVDGGTATFDHHTVVLPVRPINCRDF